MVALLYATRSVLGSRQANASQSAHMASCLSRIAGTPCVYRVTDRRRSPAENFQSYGIAAPLRVHRLRALPRQLDWLHLDLLELYTALRAHPDSTVYTRNLSQALVSATLGHPTVLELHDPLTSIRRAWLQALVASQRLRGLVVTTTRLFNDVITAFPRYPENRVLVAGNAASAENARVLASPLARTPDSFHAAYAGSALQGKGVDTIIACAQLRPTFTFHVIGPEPRVDTPANIIWHGHLPQPRLIGLLKAMDALLLPNHGSVFIRTGLDIGAHTSPLKLFEYLSCGRPVVASDLPVFSGILRHDENALLANPADPADFCAKLDLLAADPDLALRLADSAQKDFLLNHTWERRSRKILDFISSLDSAQA